MNAGWGDNLLFCAISLSSLRNFEIENDRNQEGGENEKDTYKGQEEIPFKYQC